MTVQINETAMSAHADTARYETHGFCANALRLLASGGIRLHNFSSHRPVQKERSYNMGLIKAALGAAGGTLADQWKEFFYCDAIDNDVLAVKGQKRTSKRSSNTKGSDNIITTGSGIAVADGQCMMIVEQGKIVDICAEPGEYTYDASTEPSIFSGNLGDAIMNTFHTIGKRFTFGGDTGKDQRVYYFNTKELVDINSELRTRFHFVL